MNSEDERMVIFERLLPRELRHVDAQLDPYQIERLSRQLARAEVPSKVVDALAQVVGRPDDDDFARIERDLADADTVTVTVETNDLRMLLRQHQEQVKRLQDAPDIDLRELVPGSDDEHADTTSLAALEEECQRRYRLSPWDLELVTVDVRDLGRLAAALALEIKRADRAEGLLADAEERLEALRDATEEERAERLGQLDSFLAEPREERVPARELEAARARIAELEGEVERLRAAAAPLPAATAAAPARRKAARPTLTLQSLLASAFQPGNVLRLTRRGTNPCSETWTVRGSGPRGCWVDTPSGMQWLSLVKARATGTVERFTLRTTDQQDLDIERVGGAS